MIKWTTNSLHKNHTGIIFSDTISHNITLPKSHHWISTNKEIQRESQKPESPWQSTQKHICSLVRENYKKVASNNQTLISHRKRPDHHYTLLHLMCAIEREHASIRTTRLMRVKNSTRHICLWHLLSRTLERRKWKNKNMKFNGWSFLFNLC